MPSNLPRWIGLHRIFRKLSMYGHLPLIWVHSITNMGMPPDSDKGESQRLRQDTWCHVMQNREYCWISWSGLYGLSQRQQTVIPGCYQVQECMLKKETNKWQWWMLLPWSDMNLLHWTFFPFHVVFSCLVLALLSTASIEYLAWCHHSKAWHHRNTL